MAQAKKMTLHPIAQTKVMTLHPLHDRVLLKRTEEEPARRGAIIVPDSAKEKPQEGKVIAVGNGTVSEAGLGGSLVSAAAESAAAWRRRRLSSDPSGSGSRSPRLLRCRTAR
jgi:hypothetical protein